MPPKRTDAVQQRGELKLPAYEGPPAMEYATAAAG